MCTLTDRAIERLRAALQQEQLQHQRHRTAWATERALLRRLLDEARDERDRARDALALWTAGEYEAGLVVERALEREQRALADAARVAADRDRAIELLRRLAPTDPDVQAIRRSSGSGEYGAANG